MKNRFKILAILLITIFIAGCAVIEPEPSNPMEKIQTKENFVNVFQDKNLARNLLPIFDLGKTKFGSDYLDNTYKMADYEDRVQLVNVPLFLAKVKVKPFDVYMDAVKNNGSKLRKFSSKFNSILVQETVFKAPFTTTLNGCFEESYSCMLYEFPAFAEEKNGKIVSIMLNFIELNAAFNNYADRFTPARLVMHTIIYEGEKLDYLLKYIPKRLFTDEELE